MFRQFVCPQGHQWEVGTADAARRSRTPAVCPVCSAPAVVPNPRTEAFVPECPRPTGGAPPGPATLPPTAPVAVDEGTELPTVPGYEVMGVLGRGGMGVVYQAWQPELNRIVALKMVLAGAHAGSQELARFHNEAEAVARLQHPHIVQIYGVGRHDEHPYLVLEYVDGGNLAQQLTGTPLPARRAAELVATLARAVHYAHERGIVHRDLTPGNVLLTADGQPKITDFGLAKLLVGGAVRTQSGAIVGTPSYMAPEQAGGKTKEIGPAADVYGLGAILYELLTGRPPFRAETTLETLLQVQSEEPVPPSRLQPNLPRDLATSCLKALAKEPGRRYQTAGALADDLRRFLQGEPIQARAVGVWERGWRWARRRPAAAALLLVSGVAALALVGAAVAFVYNQRLEATNAELGESNRLTERARQEAEAQGRRAEAALDLATFHQYFHHIARAQMGLREGDLGGVEQLLDDCPLDQRRWEWAYLKRQCHADLATLTGHNSVVISVAFSPDGTRLASAGGEGTVKIWDVSTGQEVRTLTGHTHAVWSVAFSPDGTRLASASEDLTVRVWDTATGQEALPPLKGHTSLVRSVAFSPDGTRLASAGWDQTVRVWNAATGQEVFTLRGHTLRAVNSVTFSPDGTRLASGSEDRKVKLWDATTGRWIRDLIGHNNTVSSVAFSPDGTRLASASADRTVKVWDATTGQWIRDLKGHADYVLHLTFSPDGSRLASSGMDRTVKVWDATTGEVLHTLKGHTRGIVSVAFNPTGTWLASASMDQTVKIWDATTSPEARTLPGHVFRLWSVAFSPDGTRLASAGARGTVKVWDATTGQVVHSLTGQTPVLYSVAFSPDGTRLVSAGANSASTKTPGEVKIWDARTGREVLALKGLTSGAFAVVFSPDSSRLASGNGDGTVTLWDATTGQQALLPLQGHTLEVWSVAFSPDGTHLASASEDGTVKVWNATTGQELLSFKITGPHRTVRTVAFSPDGARLASGWDSGSVRVWDVRTGREVHTLTGRASYPFGIAFSPDGTRLAASATGSDTVEIWDATAGLEVLRLQGHTGPVRGLAFNRAGTQIATAGYDGTVKIWDARPWTPEAALEREALGRLDFLFTKPLSTADVLEHLQSAPMLRPQARQLALELVRHYREETDPDRYHQASWAVVRQPYLNDFQYGFALQQAQAASQRAPDQEKNRTVLGMAQYRLGRYQEALATLTRPDRLSAGSPADLAFLAMTQHRLGQTEQSRATLASFRESLSKPEWTPNEELQAFLREAEQLMSGQPALPKE